MNYRDLMAYGGRLITKKHIVSEIRRVRDGGPVDPDTPDYKLASQYLTEIMSLFTKPSDYAIHEHIKWEKRSEINSKYNCILEGMYRE